MRRLCAALCAAMLLLAVSVRAGAQGSLLPLPEEKPIIGINTPALSPDARTLCFSYLGDLWTVPVTGGVATRLTVHEAHDAYPRWSPDGQWIAFASNRDGYYGLYVIPAAGGAARQLTHYTATNYPLDWSADGTKILFMSTRNTGTWETYTIDVQKGVVKTLTDDTSNIRYATFSPDGQSITYNRAGDVAYWWRPRYRGSANMDIYTKSLATGKITRVTDYDGMDMWPMYAADGKTLYYVSDRLTPGTPNLVHSPASGGKPALLTRHTIGAVRWPAIAHNGSLIVYIHEGSLYVVSATGGQPKKVVIYARSDDKQNNLVRLNLSNEATEVEVAPDGKTLALVVRGEIWTIPSDRGGEAKRLTSNPANDYDIYWSPDSAKIAFISDRKGNFDLYTIDLNTKEEKVVSADPNDENMPHWSPDSKSIAFLRSGAQSGLYLANADGSGAPRRIADAEGNNLQGTGINSYAWSPDSKWIAFSRRDETLTRDVWIVPTAGGSPVNVTYYPGTNDDPEWTSDGKYLLFTSNRDSGQSEDLYAIPLQKEKEEPMPSPLASSPSAGRGSVGVKIDFDEIERRAKRLTTQGVFGFQIAPDGKNAIFVSTAAGPPDYFSVPVGGGPAQRMTGTGEGTFTPRFAGDSNKFYALGAGGTVKAIQRFGPIWQAIPIAFTARMELDRRAEIAQAFNEFWRRINVGFYDPKMHGVDWKAVRARYEPLLSGVATKEEFAGYVLSPMIGELNASHTEIFPATGPPAASTAQLGLTFDENYAGPGLKVTGYAPKGPNDDLGPKIKPGEYVLQIDGENVSWNESLSDLLLDKAGKTVELTVSAAPPASGNSSAATGVRTVKLKAMNFGQARELEYQRTLRESREIVKKLSQGRLAYIHLRDMMPATESVFERELWGAAREKEGLVLDIRNNGGGNIHDQLLNQLSRTPYAYNQPRDGLRSWQPTRYWNKPIVLLINQNSASDAEIFPQGFRALKLGKIVGVPTPGYVIGTFDGRLQDGTSYRIPMIGYYYADGKNLENNGVRPDILVEHTPEDIATHRDRQLEVAVETLLKELPKK